MKAASNAHITLKADNGELYEVLLGGWNNQKSCLRQYHIRGYCLSEFWGPILNDTMFLPFWISWTDSNIRVGFGEVAGLSELMEYYDPTPIEITTLAITTGVCHIILTTMRVIWLAPPNYYLTKLQRLLESAMFQLKIYITKTKGKSDRGAQV